MSSKVIVTIFGASGDLAKRKLYPSLFRLYKSGNLSKHFAVIGTARRPWSKEYFESVVVESILDLADSTEQAQEFASHFYYQSHDVNDTEHYIALRQLQAELNDKYQAEHNKLFFLSMAPQFFGTIAKHLKSENIVDGKGFERLIVEKPFGTDYASASKLNDELLATFDEEQIFRIDHYLGKETVQNLLALRFANMMFEPVWNSNYVSHVEITMAEDIGIGGRAGYYDGIGAARDVIQNHLLQLMALTAMEEPASFNAKDLAIEKLKVLSSVRLPEDLAAHTARGQYSAGWQGSEKVVGYLEEAGISQDSTTETYAAVRLDIDTRRWAGVPFYLRTGKRLGKRVTEIAVNFKRAPHLPFDSTSTQELGENAIVIRVQPDEGITLRFGSKVPGTAMEVRDVNMDFTYGNSFTEASPEAYERLILDVMLGDPPLFPTSREIDLSWKILDPIEEFWSAQGQPEPYRAGTWGPAQADAMLANDGHSWRIP